MKIETIGKEVFSDGELTLIEDIFKWLLEAKDEKVHGLKVELSALELADCRNILKKVRS